MADFCLKCFNETWNKNLTEEQVLLCTDFCEGCAEEKPCVILVYDDKRRPCKFKLTSFFKRK
ncbi:MAG: hypothetical protein IIW94_01050 [Clostridia bacterium]|nr:hypothetical protein [Clostridia bacterium]